jgi:hypothetical protein
MAIVFSISCCASRQTHFFVQTVPAVHTRGESEATAKKKATTTRFFSSRTQRLGLHNHQRRFRIPNPHTLRACLYIHSGRVCVFFPVFIAKKALPTDHSSRYCQVVQDMSRMTLSVSSVSFCPSCRHSTVYASIIIPCIIMIIHSPPPQWRGQKSPNHIHFMQIDS